MSDGSIFYEIFPLSLKRHGEEVCGDQVKLFRQSDKTIVVLSDGLGSGIKAAILARLTTEIIVTMLRAEAPLREVIQTVMNTLPTCRVRELAYATFAILQIHHSDGRFQLVSFDSPPPVLLRGYELQRLDSHAETLCGKLLTLSDGVLKSGDFLGLMSDGVLYADEGVIMNPGWGWDEVAAHLATAARSGQGSAERLVRGLMRETERRYGGNVGDDATVVGVLARKPRRLVVFTGPPADPRHDQACVERFLQFDGRHAVCGGTSANIVALQTGEVVRTDAATAREGIPPIGTLAGVDLVTEGILTLARALEFLQASKGDPDELPSDHNAAVLLSQEMLRADSVLFMAGESVNPYYQNPQLPRSMSIRRSLVMQLSETLSRFQKEVRVEWI